MKNEGLNRAFKQTSRWLSGCTALTLLLSGHAALAQDRSDATPPEGEARGVDDIVVTAQRREQSITKVPISITALDTQALDDRQINEMKDLQFASPGIRAGHQQGVTRIFIRGIGLNSFASGADPSVAFYADGVYVGRPTAQASSFFDVERIEVLRGPQGTLYGRNATGGAVNVISRAPDRDAGGYANFSYGNFDLIELEGAVNVPLTQNGDLRFRLAGHLTDRDGYGTDVTGGHPVNDANAHSLRGQLQYENGNGVDIRLIGEYHREKDNNHFTLGFGAYPGYVLSGVTGVTAPDGTVYQGIAVTAGQNAATALTGNTNSREGRAVTLNANFEISDSLSFNSITGYRSWDRYNASNSDGTSAGIGNTFYNEQSDQISQEYVFNWNRGVVNIVAGGSYYYEKLKNHVLVPFVQFGPLLYIQDGSLKIDALAGYAQATVAVTPTLRLTAGGRYSTETRTNRGTFSFTSVVPVSGKRSWSDFNPKVGIEYDLNDSTLLYATATNGFKSGTFNVGQVNPAIDPEGIWAYEAGFKTRLFDNSLQLSGAVFHYDYSNLQVNKIIGIATLTTNAAAAKIDGFELSGSWRPAPGLTIDASFNYLDARFSEFLSTNPLYPTGPSDPGFAIWQTANPGASVPLFGGAGGSEQDLSGYMLPGAPKYSATGGIQYEHEMPGGAITARIDAAYSSRVHFSEFNDKNLSQASVTKVNAFIRYESDSFWSLSLWGKNLTDEYIKSNELITIALWGFPLYGSVEPPRTYGATLGLKF